jgi:hypothetical protein
MTLHSIFSKSNQVSELKKLKYQKRVLPKKIESVVMAPSSLHKTENWKITDRKSRSCLRVSASPNKRNKLWFWIAWIQEFNLEFLLKSWVCQNFEEFFTFLKKRCSGCSSKCVARFCKQVNFSAKITEKWPNENFLENDETRKQQ